MVYQDKPPINELMHYGMPRRSGRYPWGSGKEPYQHAGDLISRVDELKKKGLKPTEIAETIGLTTGELRTQLSVAKAEQRALKVDTAKSLTKDGLTPTEIGKKMGVNESTVRSWLNTDSEVRMNKARSLANILKKNVDEKGPIDVGPGIEYELGSKISKEKLNQALFIMEQDGYPTYTFGVPQATNPGKQINVTALCPPGTEYKEMYKFKNGEVNVHTITDYETHDGGDTFEPKFVYPKSMDSKRLAIRYAEDGGLSKDGAIEIRRGVDDLSLGNSRYAQVRILVDGTHYIKGMATYSDNLPDGVDVIFNTNKKKGTPKMDVLKEIKDDPDNPFGSLIKEGINEPGKPSVRGGQSYYIDKNGKKQLSLINKRAEEGDWGEWGNKLPAQFLAKQPIPLIKKQLGLSIADKQAEFDEICSLTNPTVKKKLLESFANDCDSAAVHLKAAALPRQRYQVIYPIPSLSDKEIYAPNYKTGEKVALVRYPHGGLFEIPILTVNNNHKEGKKVLGNAIDAVGINSKIAEQLSGADFDGDTVMVIPHGGKTKIANQKPLDGLKDFDPKMQYGTKAVKTGKHDAKGKEIIDYYNESGSKVKIMKNTQIEMGIVSNLISDMTLKGAKDDEIARAVRHSMVVIDAEKHKLDYKQSYKDNGIAALKKEYQGHIGEDGKYHEGASTLISRAKSEANPPKRKGQPWINQETGALEWERINPKTGKFETKYVHEEYTDKNGKPALRTTKSTKMAETSDAYSLISTARTPQEEAYANYANSMKAFANKARKEMISTGRIAYSKEASKTYQKEVDHLMAQLNVCKKNKPRERQAQIVANSIVAAKQKDNPDMSKKEIKKAKQIALTEARNRFGAKRIPIEINDKEWEAIQKGAITENVLKDILNYADLDKVKERATPRTVNAIPKSKISLIKTMSSRGYTNAEIAQRLGVSTSTVHKYIK